MTVALYRDKDDPLCVEAIKPDEYQRDTALQRYWTLIEGTETEIEIPAPEPEGIELVEYENAGGVLWWTSGHVGHLMATGRRGTLTITEGENG